MQQPSSTDAAVALQRAYYERTAQSYDTLQVDPADEHFMALAWMSAMIEQRQFTTMLDVGSGTGRALQYVKQRNGPAIAVTGLEPSAALRDIGHQKGLSQEELVDGDALALPFADGSFDLVCSFGVLHHIADHGQAVREMTRVARRAVFISDANNFGQGSLPNRIMKQLLKATGLWRLFDFARTGFKGYHYSEGDGVFYSYSLFDDIPIIKVKFPDLHFMSTRPSGSNLYRSAQTIALFATRPHQG